MLLCGLGGTEDGVIGALAAVGLMNTHDDGRVIHVGRSRIDHYHVAGVQDVERMSDFGVDALYSLSGRHPVHFGRVDVGKRLRPNYRNGKVVLFVSASNEEGIDWHAERIL
jgi:hypothetical protein